MTFPDGTVKEGLFQNNIYVGDIEFEEINKNQNAHQLISIMD